MIKHPFTLLFILPYTLLAIVAIVFMIRFDHGTEILWFNEMGQEPFDTFFKYWTYVGDGWIFTCVLVPLLLMKKWRHCLVFGILGGLQLVVSSVLKRIFFAAVPRPRTYFDHFSLDYIEGVKIYGHYSFPSGHTLTAFSVAAFLALVLQNKKWTLILFLFASLVAVSRMYLLQHFIEDVTAGSAIGIILAFLTQWFFRSYLESETPLLLKKSG